MLRPAPLLTLFLVPPLLLTPIILSGCGSSESSPQEPTPSPAQRDATGAEPRHAADGNVFDASMTGGESMPPVDDVPNAQQRLAEQKFEEFVGPLPSTEDWDRLHTELVEMGEAAVPVLAKQLDSDDPQRRESASSLLALIGPQASGAKPALQRALTDSSAYVRIHAATALGQLGGDVDEPLKVVVELLGSDRDDVREMATVNLSFFGPEAADAHRVLLPLLQSDDPAVVTAVAEALGRMGPAAADARPALEQRLQTADGEVHTAIETALAAIDEADEG